MRLFLVRCSAIGWFWCLGWVLWCVVFMLLLDLVMSCNNVCIIVMLLTVITLWWARIAMGG